MMKKFLINYFPFILFGLLLIFFTRKFLFAGGYILYGEFFGSTNYIFFFKQLLNSWGDYTGFGHSNIGSSTSYGLNPVFFVIPPGFNFQFLAILSILELVFGTFSMKVYILLALSLPFMGMYFLAKHWFKKDIENPTVLNSISLTAGLIYSISGQMSSRIMAGHLRYSLAHGLFPLLILFTLKAVETKEKKIRYFYIILSGLIISSLIWMMPHLLTLYLILIGFYLLALAIKDNVRIKLLLIIVISAGLIGFLLNIHIWLPSLFFREPLLSIETPFYSWSFVNMTSRATKFINLLTNTSSSEKSLIGDRAYQTLLNLKLLMPIVGLIGLLLYRNKKKAIFLLLAALVGLFFSWGINYPFEEIYTFLFSSVFLFKPFRDVGKFAILYLFSLSLLIPYVFIYLYKFINKKIIFTALILFNLFLLYVNPRFLTGDFGNIIIPFNLPKKYQNLNRFLSDQKKDFRVAVYPNDKNTANYSWYPKTLLPSYNFSIFHSLLPLSKNLAISGRTMTDWSSRYLDYIELNLDKPGIVNKLGDAMVKYLIVDHSVQNYKKTLNILTDNTSLKRINEVEGFSIFEIPDYNPNLIKEKEALYYFGDIAGIKWLPEKYALINLFENADELLSRNYSNYLLLYNSSVDDLFFTTLDKYKISYFPEVRFAKDYAREFYFPGEYLRYITQTGITTYNPEIIRTEGKGNKIEKKINLKADSYRMLVSSISSPGQSNSFKITVGNQTLRAAEFRKKNESSEWINFGEIQVKGNQTTSVEVENTELGSLYIDYLLIVPANEYNKLRHDFYSKIKPFTIIEVDKLISETLLSDDIKKITVLNSSFSPNWDICTKEVFRVNFYANGSVCNSGNIKPYFKPEFIYKTAIILFFTLHGFFIIYLIKLRKNKI